MVVAQAIILLPPQPPTTTTTGVVHGNNGNSTNRLNHIRNQLLLQGVSPATFDINAITAPSSINNNNNNQRSV